MRTLFVVVFLVRSQQIENSKPSNVYDCDYYLQTISREHQSNWQDAYLHPELSASLIESHDLDVTEENLTVLSPDCEAVLSCGALTAMIMNFARFIRYYHVTINSTVTYMCVS